MEFGEKLQMLRKARGWSQEELAQQINVSRQALSKWESGASIADTENVIALSRLFGVSTDYLLLRESETTSAPTAVPTPAKEKKWPVPRIAWLVILIVGVVGRIALQIWAGTLPQMGVSGGIMGMIMGIPNFYRDLNGIQKVAHAYDLWWLVILLWVLLILGFLGTFFYEKSRAFVKKHFLP